MIDIFKALGDENRLRIINLLGKGEFCVCEVETILGLTQSNASRHLKRLKTEGIISASKDEQWIHYSINESFIENNMTLFQYLNEKFGVYNVFVEDNLRCELYKKKNLTCKDIRKNKDDVLMIIRRGGRSND